MSFSIRRGDIFYVHKFGIQVGSEEHTGRPGVVVSCDEGNRYQHKADTAFQNYQETGITRYDTARRNNEDMAEALRMAASAKEDQDRMIHLRGVLSQLAWRAAEANRASEEERPRKMQAVLGELLSAARMQGLIRDEGGDFK